MCQLGITEVADIEDRRLQLLKKSAVFQRPAADRQYKILADRLEILGVTGDLQLAGDGRVRGIREVDGKQRVDPAKGDRKRPVAHEPHRVEPLAGREIRDCPDHLEPGAMLFEHEQALLAPLLGDHAQPTFVLVHGELIDQRPVDAARCGAAKLVRLVVDVEFVDRQGGAVVPLAIVSLAVSSNIQAVAR